MMRESVRMMNLHHPHVLSLTGVCLDAGPAPYIVMPFMENGSLLEYLKAEKKNLVFPDHSMQDSEQVSAHYSTKLGGCTAIVMGRLQQCYEEQYCVPKNVISMRFDQTKSILSSTVLSPS